jgi:hypothetical protein
MHGMHGMHGVDPSEHSFCSGKHTVAILVLHVAAEPQYGLVTKINFSIFNIMDF